MLFLGALDLLYLDVTIEIKGNILSVINFVLRHTHKNYLPKQPMKFHILFWKKQCNFFGIYSKRGDVSVFEASFMG